MKKSTIKKNSAVKKATRAKNTTKPLKKASSKAPSQKSETGRKVKKSGNAAGKKKAPEKEEFPHFRRYKKSNHPALIIGEQKGKKTDNQGRACETDEYKYRKVMHNEKDGNSPNEKVNPNPNPKDPRPMYIGKRVRHDEKKNFGEKYPWKYLSGQKNEK